MSLSMGRGAKEEELNHPEAKWEIDAERSK